MQIEIKKVKRREAHFCDKCGKQFAITVPRHLRQRMDLCKCDSVVGNKKTKK